MKALNASILKTVNGGCDKLNFSPEVVKKIKKAIKEKRKHEKSSSS